MNFVLAVFFFNCFKIFAILLILMILSGKSRQNLSDYIQPLFKRLYEVNKKTVISSGKMENSSNYMLL